MKLTAKQKAGVVRAVLSVAEHHIQDDWGEPLKDVDGEPDWPVIGGSASEEAGDDLREACFDYLDTAVKKAVAAIRKARP